MKNIRKKYKNKLKSEPKGLEPSIEESVLEELALKELVLEELVYQKIGSIIKTMIEGSELQFSVKPAAEPVTEPATVIGQNGLPKEVAITGDKLGSSEPTGSDIKSIPGGYLENGGSKKNKKRKTRKNINKKRRIRKTTIKKALKNRNNKKTHKKAYKKRNLNKYRRIKKTKKKIQQTD